jgi:Ca2+/Na+ antiporter
MIIVISQKIVIDIRQEIQFSFVQAFLFFSLLSLFKNRVGLWDHVAVHVCVCVCVLPLSLLGNGSVKVPLSLPGNGSVETLPR